MACIRKRRNRWVIDFYDNRGKRSWITMPKGATKAKTTEKMREVEDKLSKGIYLPEKRIPTFAEIKKDWLDQKKVNVRHNTWEMYEMLSRCHLDSLSSYKVNRINLSRVEKLISRKREEGLSLSTLRKIIITLNQIMQYAVRHKYIDHNPVRDAERPRDQGQEENEKLLILSIDEINTFLESEKNLKYKTLFTLAVMSGARQGELIGLKWTDIDFFNSQIQIRRTFNHGRWYQPKTKTSNRRIDIGPSVLRTLKEWRLACPRTELDLVFPNSANGPIDQSKLLKKYFYPALKRAKLPKIRFHDLRHTYASLLIDQGENIKYIQSQLGHASPSVTLNVYAHLMKPINQEAACRLGKAIFKNDSSKMVAENKKGIMP